LTKLLWGEKKFPEAWLIALGNALYSGTIPLFTCHTQHCPTQMCVD